MVYGEVLSSNSAFDCGPGYSVMFSLHCNNAYRFKDFYMGHLRFLSRLCPYFTPRMNIVYDFKEVLICTYTLFCANKSCHLIPVRHQSLK